MICPECRARKNEAHAPHCPFVARCLSAVEEIEQIVMRPNIDGTNYAADALAVRRIRQVVARAFSLGTWMTARLPDGSCRSCGAAENEHHFSDCPMIAEMQVKQGHFVILPRRVEVVQPRAILCRPGERETVEKIVQANAIEQSTALPPYPARGRVEAPIHLLIAPGRRPCGRDQADGGSTAIAGDVTCENCLRFIRDERRIAAEIATLPPCPPRRGEPGPNVIIEGAGK